MWNTIGHEMHKTSHFLSDSLWVMNTAELICSNIFSMDNEENSKYLLDVWNEKEATKTKCDIYPNVYVHVQTWNWSTRFLLNRWHI